MQTRVVWVTSWQLECCGKPFSIGSRICWDVRPSRDSAQRRNLLGSLADDVTDDYDAHADEGETSMLSGRVESIAAAFSLHENNQSVPGSLVLEDRSMATGAEPDPLREKGYWEPSDLFFRGYLVLVTPT